MHASLPLIGSLAPVEVWLLSGGTVWLAGGLYLFAIVPLTLLFIAPTTRRLHDPVLERGSPQADGLLHRWGRRHAIRSVLSVVALTLFLLG